MALQSKLKSSPRLWWLLPPPLLLSAALYFVTVGVYRLVDLADRRLEFVTQLGSLLST